MTLYSIKKILSRIIVCLVCLVSWANAIELNGNVSTETEYSNNSNLVSTKKLDEVSQLVGLDFNVLENRRDVQANADFRIESKRYFKNTFSDQTSLTAGFGLFNVNLIDSFLNWQTSFTRTEVLSDTTDTNTPDNREYRNILRTGPSISYQISRSSFMGYTLNYVSVENSGETASDSQRVNSNLNYKYLFNTVTDFSISGQYENVIDSEENEKYENISFSLGLIRRFSLGDAQFNYGRTRLSPKRGDATEGNYFDFKLNRKKLFWHDISLTYLEDISDTSIGFESDEQGAETGSGVQRSVSTNDVVKRRRLELEVNRVLGSLSYAIKGFWENQTFVIQENDEKSLGLSVGLSNQWTQNLVTEFDYIFQIDDFIDRPEVGKDRVSTYELGCRYNIVTNFSVSSFVRFSSLYNHQNMTREYEEFASGFGFVWSFL